MVLKSLSVSEPVAVDAARPLVVAGMTERGALAAPRQLALVSGDRRIDYGDLHDLVLRAVAALKSIG
ncbi:MAG TPA: hypothetical protein VF147_03100, partial [Vicinamibacterales bacterium]